MERSGVTPQVAPDTSDLADLAQAAGPFLSLVLTTEAVVAEIPEEKKLTEATMAEM